MAKVVQVQEIGGPEKLKFEEVEARQPGPGEVKLQVQAVGLNRAEALYMRGLYFEQPKLPSLLGYEAAGTVEAVGEGVAPSWIGKQVSTVPGFSMNDFGVLGQSAIVPADVLAEYPAALTPVQGAAIWMQYMTTYGALIMLGKLKKGDVVIITAASSSVGLAAIQMVKAEGGIAIATTRTSKKKEELLALGADHVIATEEEDLGKRVREITGGGGARIAFDAIAGPFVDKLADAMAPGGVIFVYGALSLAPTHFPLRAAMAKGLSVRGYTLLELRDNPVAYQEGIRYVFERLQDGRFVPKIANTFPFADSIAAYQYLESNQQVGKVVITL